MHTDRAGREALLERFRRSNEEAGREMDIHRQKAEELTDPVPPAEGAAGHRWRRRSWSWSAAAPSRIRRCQRCNEELLHTEREVARLEQQKNAAAMEEKQHPRQAVGEL